MPVLDWLDPRTAFAVLIYLAGPAMLLIGIVYAFEVLKAYAPPPFFRLLSNKPLPHGRWLLWVEWRGRKLKAIEGREHDWVYAGSRRQPRSPTLLRCLRWQWEQLDRMNVEEEEMNEAAEVDDRVIRMEEIEA